MTAALPVALHRRLLLAWCGWRYVDGAWWFGRTRLSEQELDDMSPQAWGRYIRRWLTSATN